MSEADIAEAVAAARAFIAERVRGDWHSVAAVVLTGSGGRYIALNVECTLPRASVCAEPIAIGMAMSADPDDRITFCAAVNRRGEVIAPCGACRELMLDYARDAGIAVPGREDFVVLPLADLMPSPYKAGARRQA